MAAARKLAPLTESQIAELAVRVDVAYQQLQAALSALGTAVKAEHHLPAQAWELPLLKLGDSRAKGDDIEVTQVRGAPASVRKHIAEFLEKLGYEPTQHPNSAERLPGYVAASPTTLALITNPRSGVNARKLAFATLLRGLDQEDLKALRKQCKHIANVSLHQAQRKVPVWGAPTPDRLGFTWIRGAKSFHRECTARELADRFRADYQLDAAARLLCELQPLDRVRVVRDKKPYPAVNVVVRKGRLERGGDIAPLAAQVRASLPLFFLAGPSPPAVTPLQDLKGGDDVARRTRAGVKWVQLKSIPKVYRWAG